jgi:hypothetical protein
MAAIGEFNRARAIVTGIAKAKHSVRKLFTTYPTLIALN